MSKNILILTLVALMWSCNFFQSPGKDRCQKIVSQEKMKEILTDVYLMEGYLLEVQMSKANIRDSSAYYYQTVFNKHDISYEIFNEALSCYLLHSEEIEQIHESILNDLSIHMGELQAEAYSRSMITGEDGEVEMPEDFIGPPEDPFFPDWQLEQEEENPQEQQLRYAPPQ